MPAFAGPGGGTAAPAPQPFAYTVQADGAVVEAKGLLASHTLAPVLGAPMARGRWFAPDEDRPGGPRVALWMTGVAAVVLLVACANVADLAPARAPEERRALATRAALGAGRGRPAGPLAAEVAVLAAAGGALALVLAVWGGAAVRNRLLALDAAGDAASRVLRPLVALQVGLALVLVVGAALFGASLHNAGTVDVGFDPRGPLVADVDLRAAGVTGPRIAGTYAVRLAPGVPEGAAREAVRRTLADLVPALPLVRVQDVAEFYAPQLHSWELGATLDAAFGVAALLYGVTPLAPLPYVGAAAALLAAALLAALGPARRAGRVPPARALAAE